MKDNSLCELTVEQEHINLLKKALSSYICLIYDGIDNDVVDVDSSMEDIKVLSDMLAVLKGQNTHKASSDKVGLMWMKEVDLEVHDSEYINQLFSEFGICTPKSDEERQQEINEKVAQAKEALNTFSYEPKEETWKERYDRYRRNIQIF